MRTNDHPARSFVEHRSQVGLPSKTPDRLTNQELSRVMEQGADRDATDPEYPLERICSHCYAPFQLTFARQAAQLVREADEVDVEATHRGLLLRGETEEAFVHSVQLLRDYFGNQIRIGPAVVRYHNGATVEEPHMGLRVLCGPEHFEPVKADLDARDAVIVASEIGPTCAVIRATVPLAKVLGYASHLAKQTSGTAHHSMWLSHYAPLEVWPPDNTAA